MLNTCAALRNCFVIGSYSRFAIGIERKRSTNTPFRGDVSVLR
jgi:hypothetical protein